MFGGRQGLGFGSGSHTGSLNQRRGYNSSLSSGNGYGGGILGLATPLGTGLGLGLGSGLGGGGGLGLGLGSGLGGSGSLNRLSPSLGFASTSLATPRNSLQRAALSPFVGSQNDINSILNLIGSAQRSGFSRSTNLSNQSSLRPLSGQYNSRLNGLRPRDEYFTIPVVFRNARDAYTGRDSVLQLGFSIDMPINDIIVEIQQHVGQRFMHAIEAYLSNGSNYSIEEFRIGEDLYRNEVSSLLVLFED